MRCSRLVALFWSEAFAPQGARVAQPAELAQFLTGLGGESQVFFKTSQGGRFFQSPKTGLGGPSGPLRQALKEAGIGIEIH